MEAKLPRKSPLWFVTTLCAINIAFGLFHNASTVALFQPFRHWDCINKYFEGSNDRWAKVPAIVGIILCDLLLIASAMIPKKTLDQSNKSVEKCGRRPYIAFVTTSLYALLSIAIMMVVFAIKEGHWDSTEEMNEVRNVAKMHGIFTMLFMVLVLIWQRVLPDLKNIVFTSQSEESKAKIETGEKTDIENPPPTYSEVLEIAIENPPPNYSEVAQITIKDNENVPLDNVSLESVSFENVPLEIVVPRENAQEVAEILASLKMTNPPPKYSEAPQN